MSSENYSEKWTCKRCQSEFTLNWRDLSLQVDRDVLKLHQLNAPPIGKEPLTPIPFYVGLYGHSYPSHEEIQPVSFESFKCYILER